jgi:hypothetical protein
MSVVSRSTSLKFRGCLPSVALLMVHLIFMVCAPSAQAGATTTTLALSSSSVSSGTIVTFTATVSNGAPVTLGTVTFCDATATLCVDSAVIATAQLTSAGTAIIKLIPGIGSHSYQAQFTPAGANAASTSSAQSLTVTGFYTTATAISSTGSAGNYTLTGTTIGTGSLALSPTGSVSFLDTTNGNHVVGSAPLGTATLAQTFAAGVGYAAGVELHSVSVGDFNGDGIPDLALASYGSNAVSILLGKGDGTFQNPVNYATGSKPSTVAVGDFNGDGKLDLAVTNQGSTTVGVLLGNGDGTFRTQVTYTTGMAPNTVAVGDFNGDGKLDLAVANFNSNTVGILLGNGDGTFQTQVTHSVGTNPYSVSVGDFNGDGKQDLVATNSASNTISVLIGNGDGTFQTQVTYATGNTPYSMAIGDFNGDGKLDVAVSNHTAASAGILLGNGDGTFRTQVTYATQTFPARIAVADFNGDGKDDLAIVNTNSSSVSVLRGNGDGTFQSQLIFATPSPFFVAVGDFNGDGLPDLAAVSDATNSTVNVLLNQVTQTATAAEPNVSIPGTGSHLLDASYPGDNNFASSISSTMSFTASPAPTTLTLNANPTSSTYGLSVTLTATLSPSTLGGLNTLGETVTFNNGTVTLGTGTLNSLGIATLALTTLPAGVDSLTAVYAGDSNFLTSTSSSLNFAVTPALLIVAAQNAIRAIGTANPVFAYAITGFLNSDTQSSATTGRPSLTTTATSSSPTGTYTITAAVGTFAAANYNVTFVNGTLEVTAPRNMQFDLQGLNETVPNAIPVSSAGFGNSAATCSFSQSSNPLQLCYNPLEMIFNLNLPAVVPANPTSIPEASLGIIGSDSSTNILFGTNSVDANAGGFVTTTASCDATGLITNLTLAVTMDDGSTFTFTANSGKCDFSQPITGTLTSNSVLSPGDSGTFVLTPYAAIDGTYEGVFDSGGTSLNSGGTGTATFNISTNADYTVNATATLPAGSLCAAQTSPISLSTSDPLAKTDGPAPGISGTAIGDDLELVMGDGQGNVTVMFASGFDLSTDQSVSWPSQLYFSAYAQAGVCEGQFAWDKVFTLKRGHSRSPIVALPYRHRNWTPFRWTAKRSAVHERERSNLRQLDGVGSAFSAR